MPKFTHRLDLAMKGKIYSSFTHKLNLATKAKIYSSFIRSSGESGNEGGDFLIVHSLIRGIWQRMGRFIHRSFTHKLYQAMKAKIYSSFIHSSGESGNEGDDFFIIHSLIGWISQRRR